MVTKVNAPKVWGARVNRQAQMRTHLSIYKVILCGVTLSHHPNNCSKMYHYVNERIGRSPRHSLKDAKETRHKNVPLGNCLQPLSFSSFLLQLICFVIEL